MRLIQIDAPHFCAGLIVKKGVVIEAAPILRWTIGKQEDSVRKYVYSKGWKAWRVIINGVLVF